MTRGWIDRFSHWLLRWSMRLTAPEQMDWTQAMMAELAHVPSRMGRLRWSAGCSLLLLRQWLLHSAQNLWEGQRVKKPVIVVLLTCAVLMAVLLCLPEFREGSLVAARLVRNAAAQLRGKDTGQALDQIAKRAEREHNARLFAYVALRAVGYSDAGERRAVASARRAVELDPGLTWIFSPVCSTYHANLSADCGEMIQRLESWDPGNSIPYLLEAQRIAHQLDPEGHAIGKAPTDTGWRQVMAMAFGAPRYDAYEKRSSELQRSLYTDQHESSLADFADGLVFNNRFPDMSQIVSYARASDDPQMVIDFARRLNAGADTDLEQYLAGSLLLQAYGRANAQKPGSFSDFQIASDKKVMRVGAERDLTYAALLRPLAQTFQVIVFMLAVFGAALVIFLLVCGWKVVRSEAVSYWLQTLLSLSAGGFGMSSVGMLLVYRPYSALAHSFLQNPNPPSSLAPWIFAELYHPMFWNGPTTTGWTALLVLCGVALTAVLTKAIWERGRALLYRGAGSGRFV